MNRWGLFWLVGAVLLGAVASGCVAAPAPGPGPTRPSAAPSPAYADVAAPSPELGIDVDFYTYPGQDVAAAASADVAYVKSLHANAISVSFPFFTPGAKSSRVEGTDMTPSPSDLALLAGLAERAGLYVSFRPLLDEGPHSIGTSRTAWRPARARAWFASYRKFLMPYAAMAQQARVPEFFDGAEFSAFGHSRLWNGLVTALRAAYTGKMAYANNWGIPLAGNGGSGVTETVDSYQPLPVPTRASVGQLTGGWRAYDRTLPPGTVETEIDIAAVPGAYAQPYQTHWAVTRLVPVIQTRWFTAACDAARRERLGGVYFWAVGVGQSLDRPPTASDPADWVAGPGARAISACFQRLAS